jgi:hypothetical protein
LVIVQRTRGFGCLQRAMYERLDGTNMHSTVRRTGHPRMKAIAAVTCNTVEHPLYYDADDAADDVIEQPGQLQSS